MRSTSIGIRVTRVTLLWVCVLLPAWSAATAYDNPQEHLEIPFIDVVPLLEDFADMKPADHLQGKMTKVSNFIQREPHDGATPAFPTEVYIAYDKDRLYAVFVAFDDEPEKIRANMAPRGEVFNDDSVNIMIDTFNDQRRAYFFSLHATRESSPTDSSSRARDSMDRSRRCGIPTHG